MLIEHKMLKEHKIVLDCCKGFCFWHQGLSLCGQKIPSPSSSDRCGSLHVENRRPIKGSHRRSTRHPGGSSSLRRIERRAVFGPATELAKPDVRWEKRAPSAPRFC